jgi:hypothetical protein
VRGFFNPISSRHRPLLADRCAHAAGVHAAKQDDAVIGHHFF